MGNDSSNGEQSTRGEETPQPPHADTTAPQSAQPPGSNPGDDSREKLAWALFALLAVYVGLHPFLPNYVPDPAIVGALITGIITLVASRTFQGR